LEIRIWHMIDAVTAVFLLPLSSPSIFFLSFDASNSLVAAETNTATYLRLGVAWWTTVCRGVFAPWRETHLPTT
jgi:hypothetical protein